MVNNVLIPFTYKFINDLRPETGIFETNNTKYDRHKVEFSNLTAIYSEHKSKPLNTNGFILDSRCFCMYPKGVQEAMMVVDGLFVECTDPDNYYVSAKAIHCWRGYYNFFNGNDKYLRPTIISITKPRVKIDQGVITFPSVTRHETGDHSVNKVTFYFETNEGAITDEAVEFMNKRGGLTFNVLSTNYIEDTWESLTFLSILNEYRKSMFTKTNHNVPTLKKSIERLNITKISEINAGTIDFV